MTFFRNRWYEIGGCILILLAIFLLVMRPDWSTIQYLLVFNFMALLAHQVEEYRFPGGASPVINRVVYDEKRLTDRYPGNTQSIMIVNSSAWIIYVISIFLPHVYWFGLGVMFFSLFQILGHVLQMNIKLKTWYNPGMLTTIFLLFPIGVKYIQEVVSKNLINDWDWVLAILILLACIALTIVAPVQLLKNKDTKYIISDWQMERFRKITQLANLKNNRN